MRRAVALDADDLARVCCGNVSAMLRLGFATGVTRS
jgi:hypothetical protein